MDKEARIRALTKLYYSRPEIQQALLAFAQDREVVPRYFEGFGKRPDMLQYPGDIMGVVHKGATSFHGSEELWSDPLAINSDEGIERLSQLRKGWDLLIDIDVKYLDQAVIATQLLLEVLEQHGIQNYGVKFSGSKGFHVIVPWQAFPQTFQGQETKRMFPEWPKAIVQYLFQLVLPAYRREVGKRIPSYALTEAGKQDTMMNCLTCGQRAQKGSMVTLECEVCKTTAERRDYTPGERKLKCIAKNCSGYFAVLKQESYFFCATCKDPTNPRFSLASNRHPDQFVRARDETVGEQSDFDLVLVASRHLFRMPYSLHEKTALASCVLTKNELGTFGLRDADPLKVQPRVYLPVPREHEASSLLAAALRWKSEQGPTEEKSYAEYGTIERGPLTGVHESMFPAPIKKLLEGKMDDGKKRGLFVVITFLRACGFPPDIIAGKVRTWNATHAMPLREGYVTSQLDWHMRQKKLILPPNYDNPSFYKDLGLLKEKPTVKNPLVEVRQKLFSH